MNQYEQMYRDKRVTAEEALSRIKTGDRIGTSQCALEPRTLLSQLHTVSGRARDITVMSGAGIEEFPYMNEARYRDAFTVDGFFFMAPNRASHALGLTSYVPGHIHNGSRPWIEHNRPNVFIGQATPMDRHGYLRLSLSLIHEKEMLESADLVILEVNPNLPRVYGDTEVHIRDVSCVVEVDTPVPVLPRSQPDAVDVAIGEQIATLVRDGDTVQLGIGGIPDAAARALLHKHDLGIHTEMLTSSLVDLVEAGVVTGRSKTLFPGKIVGIFALGDERLYDLLDENPSVILMRGTYANRPEVLARNANMVSINNALAVDLIGQCCSESIGSRQYSGSGGAADTAIGAVHASGGRSIIALRSTAKGGTLSTITAQLPAGSVVTVTRNDVDYVVTEYGVAPLRGRPVRQRVENLIAVAHPDFRAGLRREAQRLTLW